ncbi:MAG: AAA family ATPase, partial [Candidatus Saccharimonadales bacterium]
MRIESLHIDGFGVWHSLQLDALADRITVFYGPNEAGKTTLLQFIRTVLYGFSPQRRQRYVPPLHGGRPGGALTLRGPSGVLTVSRYAGGAHEHALGELRISTPAGTLEGDHALAGLLGGIDETTFNHVFAVGLREMQELGTLSDSAAAELLYQLSTGLNGVSLAEVLGELAASRERVLSAGRSCQIEALLERRDKLKREIDELRGLVHRQASLTHEHAELGRAIAEQEARRAEGEQQARVIEAAVTVRSVWRQRAAVADELAGLPECTFVPPDALGRLEVLDDRLAQGRRRLPRLVRSRKAARRQISSLPFNHRLAQCAPRIEALTEQEGWLTTLAGQV